MPDILTIVPILSLFVVLAYFLGRVQGGGMNAHSRRLIHDWETIHPRAVRLLRKGRPFLVVSWDEPYYLTVYAIIRYFTQKAGKWTIEDEQLFLSEVKHTSATPLFIRAILQEWGRFQKADGTQEVINHLIDVPRGRGRY
jgi:hypothetical protein